MRPFDLFNEDRGMDQQTYLPVEMQFYVSMMFLGLTDDIHEEKPLFLQFKKNALRTNQPTDGRTDGPTDRWTDRPSYRDARTHLKKYGGRWHLLIQLKNSSDGMNQVQSI